MEPEGKKRILEGAEHLFRLRGVRSVTMDDIAKELGMSKKTLYQYFSNKAAIVFEVTQAHFENEERNCEKVINAADNAVEEMIMLLQFHSQSMSRVTPAMIYDVSTYYPKAWALFHDFKKKVIMDALLRNLKKGMEEGLYRKDLKVELTAALRMSMIEALFNPMLFDTSTFDLKEASVEQFKLFLHGITGKKGKKLIYQYLDQTEDD